MSTYIFTVLASLAIAVCHGQTQREQMAAIAVINIGNVGATAGTIELRQASPEAPLTITGEISGLEPYSVHGFHVHNSGDVRKGCGSTGGHFNPYGVTHGGPDDYTRHLGDLGNIQADETGVARINIVDKFISLCGLHSVIGRAFVVHSGIDDFGKGGAADSLKTGNAGSRIGCGIIAVL